MEHLSGGDILIRALRDANVKYIWGYPGGAALHIYDAIYNHTYFLIFLLDMSRQLCMQPMGSQERQVR